MDTNQHSQGFDEAFYLEKYPDVAQAVAAGAYSSGLAHFISNGRAEGRSGIPAQGEIPADDVSSFDEAWYLENNPDVAKAVADGRFASAYQHWTMDGRAEGRIPPPGYDEGTMFDADWYHDSYHMVRADLAANKARDLHHHYQSIGRHRGYLPNRYAPRPDNPAAIPSRFGGLWPDHGNALDLIEGRLEIGRINEAEALLMRDWVRDGYVILRQALPRDIVDRAAEELDRAYNGEIDGLRFECVTVGGYNPVPWDPAVKTSPAKALDLHWLSQPIRELIFSKPIRDTIELLFERRALASQSLTFLRGSSQGYHQDTLYVPFSLPRQFVASWIALEDVTPGGGELTYFPGSHRMPEHLYADKFKTLWDAQRMLRQNSLRDEIKDYSQRLEERSVRAGCSAQNFLAKKGDVLIWHADLAHGGLPISTGKTRASVVTHYCPKEVASLTFERGRTTVRSHEDKAWYATGYYAD